jgi:hypothetical protein
METLARWVRRIGFWSGIALGLVYITFLAYTLPSTVKVRVTGTEVVRRDVETPDGTRTVEDVNYITAEDLDGQPRIFRNVDTGWGWPPYFKFDSGDFLAQANNLANDDPPQTALLRYYGFRIPVLSWVPNTVSMHIVERNYRHVPYFNIAFGVVHAVVLLWLWLRIRRWRRSAVEVPAVSSGSPESDDPA